MAKKNLMGWVSSQKQWQKRYKGKLYRVSPKQLECEPTKELSLDAANDWWEKKKKELDDDDAPPPPSLPIRRFLQIAEWIETNQDNPFVGNSNASLFRRFAADEETAKIEWEKMIEADKAIWIDRIKTSGIFAKTETVRATSKTNSLDKAINKFLGHKHAETVADQLSLGRWGLLQSYLDEWKDFVGTVPPAKLGAAHLMDYQSRLLELIGKKKIASSTANGKLSAVKQFYRWLYKTEILDKLPRIMDDMTITVKAKKVKTLPLEYIKKLLAICGDREKLYVLLMMNCGMTQVDVADLRQDEVDWTGGAITRKRSKEKDEDNVPTVRYKLWGETFSLLKKQRSKHNDWALTNTEGGKLRTEKIVNGKWHKTDNVGVSLYRLMRTYNEKQDKKKEGEKKEEKIERQPLKLIRKTSATLLQNSSDWSQFSMLFLGHSPRGIAEKHYFGSAGKSFDDAIAWLGTQYGF